MSVLLSAGEWIVWVTTGPEDHMATTGTVTLCAYGSKAKSQPVVLGSGSEEAHFRPGATDEFKVGTLFY
jgi:PLAT/LH2 domain